MTWLRTPNVEGFDEVMNLRPAAHETFDAMFAGLWHAGVDGPTLDACQARIDALLRFEPDPTNDLDLSHASRAAVDYAEQYALDPHALRDSDFEHLHEFFSDAQLATLTLAVAIFDARARFSVALEV